MKNKSMQDVAFDLLSKKKRPVPFDKLWEEVRGMLGFDHEEAAAKVASFYTRLILDGRFVNLGDNIWDLRSRQTFDKVHIDMNDAYSEEDEDDVEVEDVEEVEFFELEEEEAKEEEEEEEFEE